MKIIFLLLLHIAFIYAKDQVCVEDQLCVGFAAINPPREVDSTKSRIGGEDLIDTRYTNIKIKNLDFTQNKEENSEIVESLDNLSESLYYALVQSGPVLSTKEKKQAKFKDVIYKNTALLPANKKAVWIFHKDRKEYGVQFLSKLSKEQNLDVIIYQKVPSRKWLKLGRGLLEKTSRIKPTIAIFNSFSQAQAYTYPSITAKNFVDEEYKIINEKIETKSIEALKRAFTVGVVGGYSQTDKSKSKDKKSSKTDKSLLDSAAGW